jgi:hypothetical protein
MELIHKIQFAASTLYFILFYIFFNNMNEGTFLEKVVFSCSLSFFSVVLVAFSIALLLILSFYRYYDYEDFIVPRRRMRRK